MEKGENWKIKVKLSKIINLIDIIERRPNTALNSKTKSKLG